MNDLLPPYISSALWFGAGACLILLLLVIFGFHLYQRSRFRAVARDAASVGALAARKETLEADVAELRRWLGEHRAEQQKADAERHQQELARAELGQLQRQLEGKRQEAQQMLARVAELDVVLEKRRQLHARLDGEIKSLEEQRRELAPMEKYAQDLRVELDQGRVRLAQMAQEEIRAQSLQTQVQMLRQEQRELTAAVEPLRQERSKLQQFISQARQAAAVKNEQLQDQRHELRQVEGQISAMESRRNELAAANEAAERRKMESESALGELRRQVQELERQGADARTAAQGEQVQLEMLLQRREEHAVEVAALLARKTVLERELERLQAHANGGGGAPIKTTGKAVDSRRMRAGKRPSPRKGARATRQRPFQGHG